jgi:hypothetical protein
MPKSARIIILLGLLICSQARAMEPQTAEALISPGKGVAQLRLLGPVPDHPDVWAKRQISFQSQNGRLMRIEVVSPSYPLEGSFIAVGRSSLDDVLRFYGDPPSVREQGPDLIVRYDVSGLEFAIDRRTNRVRLIAVFPPTQRQPDPQLLRKQLEKLWEKK